MAKHHPTARRVHREAHDEDVFVSGVLESSVWAKQHGRTLLIGGIALVAAVVIFLYLKNNRELRADKAAAELTTVRQTMLEGNNRPLAMKDLSSFVKTYGSTPSGDEARLLLAQVYLEEEHADSAIATVKPLGDDPDGSSGATGALLLGAAYEAAKNVAQAERTYLRVADKARFGFEKREALERAASLRLQKGDTKGAVELFERAKNTYPDDAPERFVYDMRIAEVRAATGS